MTWYGIIIALGFLLAVIYMMRRAPVFGLTQDDLESIVVTPYKISRSNGTKPDKHIDCIISVKSRKNFTARFNVRAPGEDDYSIRESREYQGGERVEETTADIEKELDIGGARYVFDGWYKELPGPVTDEPDPKEKVSQDEWEEGYEPTDEELENGVVNFYAHYVLADIDPDTGVETDFFGLPLMLCAGAAVLGCKNRKKEEDKCPGGPARDAGSKPVWTDEAGKKPPAAGSAQSGGAAGGVRRPALGASDAGVSGDAGVRQRDVPRREGRRPRAGLPAGKRLCQE